MVLLKLGKRLERSCAVLCAYELLVDHAVMLEGQAGMLIACESEWRPGDLDIEHDFGKLRFIKSPIKIFVCWQYQRLDAVRVCSKSIASFGQHLKGERYLIVQVGPVNARAFSWEASNDGTCPEADFQEIESSPALWSSMQVSFNST